MVSGAEEIRKNKADSGLDSGSVSGSVSGSEFGAETGRIRKPRRKSEIVTVLVSTDSAPEFCCRRRKRLALEGQWQVSKAYESTYSNMNEIHTCMSPYGASPERKGWNPMKDKNRRNG